VASFHPVYELFFFLRNKYIANTPVSAAIPIDVYVPSPDNNEKLPKETERKSIGAKQQTIIASARISKPDRPLD
jgi:hypothetical protein